MLRKYFYNSILFYLGHLFPVTERATGLWYRKSRYQIDQPWYRPCHYTGRKRVSWERPWRRPSRTWTTFVVTLGIVPWLLTGNDEINWGEGVWCCLHCHGRVAPSLSWFFSGYLDNLRMGRFCKSFSDKVNGTVLLSHPTIFIEHPKSYLNCVRNNISYSFHLKWIKTELSSVDRIQSWQSPCFRSGATLSRMSLSGRDRNSKQTAVSG